MMNEINKQNDIFISTVLNGEMDPLELNAHDITAQNTGLLTPGEYKDSPFIQKQFSDENGNFDDKKFEQTYLQAAKQYNDLIEKDTYQKLDQYIEYNMNDIFAPLGSKKNTDIQNTIQTEINPYRVSEGITSVFGRSKIEKSDRELAQQSLIFDWEKQKWMDKTAEDRGLLGSLFGQSLVYATWDSDGEHEDPISGRKIKHKKGEWKLNDQGQFYTETLGNRSGYGKQFVAASDTLTKEDSWLNKYDFFDSDDLNKSVAGTTFKTLSKIVPYFIPNFNVVYGGITGAIQLTSVIPTFAKMLEGIVTGGDADKETNFTKSMNRWENYFKKYDESYSDKGQKSNWSYEKIANTVSDIFGQLYQMRAAASISKLIKSDPTNQIVKKFKTDILPDYIQAATKKGSGLEMSAKEFDDVIKFAMNKNPDIKKAIEAQSKLSKSLSLGYMALTSSADVYQDALEGGYDRRMAGLAGLTATLGQYGVMMSDSFGLGDWFLDKTVGYSTKYNKNLLKRALQPYYDDIAKSIKTLDTQTTKTEKLNTIGNLFNKTNNGIKNFFRNVKDGSEPYWKNAIVESVEEVTEEAVMDATKGIFDTLSWLGFGKNKDASFGGFKNVFSAQGLERYALNAFGGFLGGGLFELQNKKIEPWITSKITGKILEEDQPSLIREIANGNTDKILEIAKELGDLDNEVSSINLTVDGNNINTTAMTGQQTRGQLVSNILQNYIKNIEGILIDENVNLSDSELMEKSMRDYQAIKLLEESNISKLLIDDFAKLSSDVVTIRTELENKKRELEEKNKSKKSDEESDNKPNNLNEEEALITSDYSKMSIDTLEKVLEDKRKEVSDFITGKKSEEYLKKSLAYLIPEIREASLGGVSKYIFSILKYGKEYDKLPESEGFLNKQKINEEYSQWKNITEPEKKFLEFGVKNYDDFIKKFQDSVLKYSKDNYLDVKKVVLDKLINQETLLNNNLLDDDKNYELIKKLSNSLKLEGLGGATLEEVFKQDNTKLKNSITKIVNSNDNFKNFLNFIGKSNQEFIDESSENIQNILSAINIDDLSGLTLENLINNQSLKYLKEAYQKILLDKSENFNLAELIDKLKSNNLFDNNIDISQLDLSNSDETQLFNFFVNNSLLKIDPEENYNIGINSSVLEEYLTTEKILDANIVKRVSQQALQKILNNINKISNFLSDEHFLSILIDSEDDFGSDIKNFELSNNSLKLLYDKINLDFQNKSIEEIIDEWINEIKDSDDKILEFFNFIKDNISSSIQIYSSNSEFNDIEITKDNINIDEKFEEKIYKTLKNKILDLLTSDNLYKLYNKIKNKETKQNSIYESLEKIDLILSEGEKSKVLEVLKNQHNKIKHIEKFEDYLPQGKEKEELENALQAIKLYKAVVVGMRESKYEIGNPFNYSQQLRRFLIKQGKESEAEKYKTIDITTSKYILEDLNQIEKQIEGYLMLSERSNVSKMKIDDIVKDQYSKLMLDHILNQGSKLLINGVSILPPQQELDKYENDYDKFIFLSHYVHHKFNELASSDKKKYSVLQELLDGLNIDYNEINQRNSNPSYLNQELKTLNSKDLLNWLATTIAIDSFEFFNKYNDRIITNEKNELVPLFSQELTELQTYAYVNCKNNIKNNDDKQINVYQALMEIIRSKSNDDILKIATPNLFFVNGITGAGKTHAIGSAISTLSDGKIIYVSAPTITQVNNYVESIKKYNIEPDLIQSGTKNELFKFFITSDGITEINREINKVNNIDLNNDNIINLISNNSDGLFKVIKIENRTILELNTKKVDTLIRKKLEPKFIPEIILIDECTQYSQPELQILNYLAEKFNIKIILSGDSLQKGIAFYADSQAFKDLDLWQSTRLNISIRSANNQKNNNNSQFNKALFKYEELSSQTNQSVNQSFKEYLDQPENNILINYFESENKLVGDKFVDNLLESDSDLKKMINQVREENQLNPNNPTKLMIITKLNDENNPENQSLIDKLKTLGLKADEYELFSYEDDHNKAVQGSEAKFVIVDDFGWDSEIGINLRNLYTYASRSTKGSLIQLSKDKLYNLHIINQKDKRTQIDEIPQLSNKKDLKDKKSEQIKNLLKDFTSDLTPKKIKVEKIENKEIPVRENVESQLSSKQKYEEKKSSKNKQKNDEILNEDQLSEEDYSIFVNDLNHAEPDVSGISEESINMVNSESEKQYIPESTKTTIRAYTSIDHLGIKKREIDQNYDFRNSGIHFDLDGLTQPGRFVNPIMITGFIRFRNLISSATNRDDIINGIRNDQHIAYFLSEICQKPFNDYVNNYLAYKPNEIPSLHPDRCQIMAEWANENLEIDDQIYIFGKKYNSEFDLPSTIAGVNKNQTVGDGNVQLYYGIRIRSKNDNGNSLDQWISLGSLSKKTYKDKDGNEKRFELQSFNNLYDKAEKELENKTENSLVVFKLNDVKLYENINPSSVLWLKKKTTDELNHFSETLKEAKKRGIIIDEDNLFFIDSEKILVNGKEEYKALVILAALDGSKYGKNKTDGKKFGIKELSFEEKLDKLKEQFIQPDGSLSIAGKYMTFANFCPLELDNSKSFNRIVFLSPGTNSVDKVFGDLDYVSKEEFDRLNDKRQVYRLSKCRPKSQIEIICQIFQELKVFDDEKNIRLLKTLLILRDSMTKRKSKDLDKLNNLITWVSENKSQINLINFHDKLLDLNFRALLIPVHYMFIRKNKHENFYYIVDIIDNYSINNETGYLQLQKKLNYDKENQSINSGITKIKIDPKKFPLSYTSLPLSNDKQSNSDTGKSNIDYLFLDGKFCEEKNISSLNNSQYPLSMFKVAYNKKEHDDIITFSDYQLQNFTVNFTDEQLKSAELYTGEIPNPSPNRFVNQIELSIPTKSDEDFNSYDYKPKTLSDEDYIIDTTFEKYIRYNHFCLVNPSAENPTIQYGKINGKYFELLGNKKNRSGLFKQDKYYIYTEKNEKNKKNSKYIYIDKEKNIKRYITSQIDKDYYADPKNLNTKLKIENQQGFEIRPGDIVQLYGKQDFTYRVGYVDVKNNEIVISHKGDNFADNLSKLNTGVRISPDAVTKIVKRTVYNKYQIKNDFYKNEDNFKPVNIKERKEFKEQFKTIDQMEMFVNVNDQDPFGFNESWYLAIPIKRSDNDNERSEILNPYRFFQKDVNGLPIRNTEELINTHAESIKSKDELSEYLKNIKEESNIYSGVTLYRVFKNVFPLDKNLGQINNKENSEGNQDLFWLFDLINTYNSKYLSTAGKEGSMIAHQVFFEQEEMKKYQEKFTDSNLINEDNNILANNFTSKTIKNGEDKIIKLEEKLTPNMIIKNYYEMTHTDFNKLKFNDNLFYYEIIGDKVRIYPKYAFYKGLDEGKKKIEGYKKPEDNKDIFDLSDYNEFLNKHYEISEGDSILPLLNKEFKGIKFKSLLLKIPKINNRIGEIINPGNNPSDIKLFNYQQIIYYIDHVEYNTKEKDYIIYFGNDIDINGNIINRTIDTNSNQLSDEIKPELQKINLAKFLIEIGSRYKIIDRISTENNTIKEEKLKEEKSKVTSIEVESTKSIESKPIESKPKVTSIEVESKVISSEENILNLINDIKNEVIKESIKNFINKNKIIDQNKINKIINIGKILDNFETIDFDTNDLVKEFENLDKYKIIDLFSDNMNIYKNIFDGLLYNQNYEDENILKSLYVYLTLLNDNELLNDNKFEFLKSNFENGIVTINFDYFNCKNVKELTDEIIDMYSLEGSNKNILDKIKDKISNIYEEFCK